MAALRVASMQRSSALPATTRSRAHRPCLKSALVGALLAPGFASARSACDLLECSAGGLAQLTGEGDGNSLLPLAEDDANVQFLQQDMSLMRANIVRGGSSGQQTSILHRGVERGTDAGDEAQEVRNRGEDDGTASVVADSVVATAVLDAATPAQIASYMADTSRTESSTGDSGDAMELTAADAAKLGVAMLRESQGAAVLGASIGLPPAVPLTMGLSMAMVREKKETEHPVPGTPAGAASAPIVGASADGDAVEAGAGNAEDPGDLGVATTTLSADAKALEEVSGMSLNAEGDLVAFIGALISNAFAVGFLVFVFSVLRLRYPFIYANNAIIKVAPREPGRGFLAWVRAATETTTEEVATSIGLDSAMMIEFANLGIKITAIIGVPMVFLIGPMNCLFGGKAAGDDHLSYLSFGNVENNSWLYWVHSFVVWGVVIVVQVNLFRAQSRFMKLRFAWLRSMPAVRAHTVLVENIPEEHCSDDALKAFFVHLFPGKPSRVKSAYVVKDTRNLQPLWEQKMFTETKLKEAHHFLETRMERQKVTISSLPGSESVDAITYYEAELGRLKVQIDEERKALKAGAKEVGHYNLTNGFVTFSSRMDAEIALRLHYSADKAEFVVSTPPCTTDIIWQGMQQSSTQQQVKNTIGLGLTAALYFGYLPIVLLVTNIAKLIHMGPLQPLWQGLAPTMGLQFMVAFLPTFLIWIFRLFFTLKANAWEQEKLQVWYFWFQMVFVVLATAVGQDLDALLSFTNMLFTSPTDIFVSLAKTMPYATHFYMNFIVLQWTTHAMILTRYIPLAKFLMLRKFYSVEDARALSEPEDQDYYGIGARSARWAIMMVIAIVYGTLSPPINLLACINFCVCRVVYGYLLPFAETRKPDLGGVFWVQMCRNVYHGCILYCVLMIGVFMVRAASWGPVIIATPSLAYVILAMQRFNVAFSWQRLPFSEVCKSDTKAAYAFNHPGHALKYAQPELGD